MLNKLKSAEQTGSYVSYTTGFVLSVALTLIAYFFVAHHVWSGWMLVAIIVSLAVLQLLVQLVFFLHLGHEGQPRWKSWVMLFMLIVLAILVGGSLWIMNNLNYHMMHMSPEQLNQSIIRDEGVQEAE